jgi:hypothetical protein
MPQVLWAEPFRPAEYPGASRVESYAGAGRALYAVAPVMLDCSHGFAVPSPDLPANGEPNHESISKEL